MTDEPLWTKKDVAKFLAVNVRTVERMAIPRVPLPGTGRKPIVRYDPAQVRDWWDAYRSRKLRATG
jgi:hypothetical protein